MTPATPWIRRFWRAVEDMRQRRVLARLDAHTLKDIGLEALSEERRRRARMHSAALRLGLY
jgi:uncharacterized protein YjiS (DUF1127 family)